MYLDAFSNVVFLFAAQQARGYAVSSLSKAVSREFRKLLFWGSQPFRERVLGDDPAEDPSDGSQLRPGHLQLPLCHWNLGPSRAAV